MIMELFLLPRILKDKALDIHFKGVRAVEKAFKEEGRGVVLAISHIGAWEYLSLFSILAGREWSVIVKNIKNPYLNKKITALRKQLGIHPIPKNASIKRIFESLKKNHGVAILVDQWAGPEGIWEEFFGQKTSTTSMPARIHLRHGTPLFFAACSRKALFKYEIEFIELCKDVPAKEVNERGLTRRINQFLERLILHNPKQWSWGHRRWKPQPRVVRDPDTNKRSAHFTS